MRKILQLTVIVLTFLTVFSSCKDENEKPQDNTYYEPIVIQNTATNEKTKVFKDGSILDYSNASDGYVMFKYCGKNTNIRLRVTTPQGTMPIYPIYSKDFDAVPLTNGSGEYTFELLANDGGKSFTSVGKNTVTTTISDENSPFLRPNIFVNYDTSTACIIQAAELTRGQKTIEDKVNKIYDYVVSTYTYDFDKAASVGTSAYVPNLNDVYVTKKGICFDYASTMVAMLRTQGIPSRLCVGNVDKEGTTEYHAWVAVYADDWYLLDPTFASTGGTDTDWTTKCTYTTLYYY